jgi:microcystin-dependent protein
VQQNFDALLSILNTNVILKDGTVAMDQPLQLSGDPVSALQAAPKQYVDNAMPLGSIIAYGGASAPSSQWLLCQGQAVSRSTYASLFAVIGTAFGAGNGTTTFNVPALHGRSPMGYWSGGTWASTLGAGIGAADSTVASHSHGVSIQTGTVSNDHTHGYSGTTSGHSNDHSHVLRGTGESSTPGGFGEGNVADISNGSFGPAFNTGGVSADHSHTFSGSTGGISANHSHGVNGNTAAAGGSATNTNIHPVVVCNFLIKAL